MSVNESVCMCVCVCGDGGEGCLGLQGENTAGLQDGNQTPQRLTEP